MDITTSALMAEVEAIIGAPERPPIYGWRVEFKVGDDVVTPLRINTIDLVRLYDEHYADLIFMEVFMGPGTFAHDLFPYRHNLVVTLYKDPLTVVAGESSPNEDTLHQEFTATLISNNDLVKQAEDLLLQNKEVADLTGLAKFKFQLTDPVLEQARLTSVGSTFRNQTTHDVLRYLMTETLQKIQSDETLNVVGVDMYPASNPTPQPSVVIPPMSLIEVPEYLHERVSGIYNAGLGHYLQHNHWYVYPLFDITRFENDSKGLTIVKVPKNRFPAMERTYRTTANQLIILATGDSLHQDDSESKQLNEGNGVRFANAGHMFHDFVKVEGNKATALRAENNNEFVTQPRPNERNNIRMSDRRITSNKFYELSKLARRQCTFLTVVWENSDPDLIFPGMPVKYMYLEAGEVVEIHGIVHRTQSYIESPNPPLTVRRHMCTTAIRICIQRSSSTDPQNE